MVCLRFVMIIMTTFHYLTDKYRGKIGENECLNKRYQQLQHHHNDIEQDSDWQESVTNHLIQGTKDKHQRNDTQNDNVTSQNVGKQSNHQRYRLGEYTNDFHRYQNNLYQEGYIRRVQGM